MRKRKRYLSLQEIFPHLKNVSAVSAFLSAIVLACKSGSIGNESGLSNQMMLEISPELTFGVLSLLSKAVRVCSLYSVFQKINVRSLSMTNANFIHVILYLTKAGQSLVEQWAKAFLLWDAFQKIAQTFSCK